jgi:large subunit ribosomal protein L3
VQPVRHLREVEIQDGQSVTVGQEIKADVFAVGEKVQISGTSKGKGFAGVMKRHGFHGGEMTHGSMIHRKPMSAGATDPARVLRGPSGRAAWATSA